jgi:spore maturation protein CgeB
VPPAYSGVRLLLVAKFNLRYHRTGIALRDALRAMGCEVAWVDERTRGLNALLGRSLPRRLASALRRHRPELVLVYKGAGLEPEAIDALRSAAPARWINWFPDPPHVLDLSLRIGRAYDRCFLFDTSMVERHRALGRIADYLALGFDPGFYRPLPDGRAPHLNITFVGSNEPCRAEALEALHGLGLSVRGPGWPGGPMFGDDLVRFFSNSDVAVNIHQFFGEPADLGRYGTGANQRVFELAGVGTVQLADAKADIARHFIEDSEIVLCRSTVELRAQALRLLENPEEARAIGARARERALREHTWRHRLDELLTVSLR